MNPSVVITYYENTISEAEKKLSDLKSLLKHLKKELLNQPGLAISEADVENLNIKWRKEIRDCIDEKSEFFIATSTQISAEIAFKHNYKKLYRDFKNKVATTLSLMHKEKKLAGIKKIIP